MIHQNESPSFTLYQTLSAAFCIIVVISNIVSAKMVALPYFQIIVPAGLITYPLSFFLSDLVTEIFGPKKAKMMVYIALAMNLLSLGLIEFFLILPSSVEADRIAFQSVFGLSGIRIFASLIAYVVAQVIDIQLYALIKKWTGSRFIWLRNNGSTCLSQMVDTALIDIIYLYGGLQMSWAEVMPIMCLSYAYKTFFSVANTPLFYLALFLIKTNWKSPFSTFKSQEVAYESHM